jgi:hypothetical protein
MLQDDVMDDEEAARRHAQLEAELLWIERRGGRQWLETYITPYHLKWMGHHPARDGEWSSLIPEVHDRAMELSANDISAMVQMQWRIQPMGTGMP